MTDNKDTRPDDDWRDDDVHDADVSRAYREVSGEQAPAHLDTAVLAAARRGAARGRYEHSIHWLRPMAWAATIGLCLAIVIDVTNVPEQSIPVLYDAPSAWAPEALQSEAPQETRAEEAPEIQAAPGAEAPAAAIAAPSKARQDDSGATTRTSPVLRQEAAVDESIGRRRDNDAGQADAKRAPEADLLELEPSADVASAAFEDKVVIERDQPERAAAEAARIEESLSTSAFALSPDVRLASSACPAEDVADPARWLQCIEALVAEGRTDEAEREMLRFEASYPDYAVE